MDRPIAFKVLPLGELKLSRVRVEPLNISSIGGSALPPAVIVTRRATVLADLEMGIVDATDILAVSGGDWTNAILVVSEDNIADETTRNGLKTPEGDQAFLQSVEEVAPSLVDLARVTIELVRAAGVKGQLVEKTKGRWVNSPLNSFTLKVQPQKKNLQFTLYGNPSSYQHDGFLLQDQNSYSRGWVKNESDAKILAGFAEQAYKRRVR